MTKPNGWETFGFYTKNKTLKRINEMMCSAGVYQETRKSILSKIHQAILSAEERTRKEMMGKQLAVLDKMDSIFVEFNEEDTNNGTITPVVRRTDVTKMILSLPDQAISAISNKK